MKYIKKFNENIESNIDIEGINRKSIDILKGKKFETSRSLNLPFEIKKTLKFKVTDCKAIINDGEVLLFVGVDLYEVKGSIEVNRNYDEKSAKCLAMTEYLYWNVVKQSIGEEISVMVYDTTFCDIDGWIKKWK